MNLLSKPSTLSKKSVVNWMNGNKPLIQRESRFLDHAEDLVSLSTDNDRGTFDEFIEWLLDKCIPTTIGTRVWDHAGVIKA
jgi:hypothetical protein